MSEGGPSMPGKNARARWEWAAAALLLATAAGFRAPGLFRGFWADELYTLRTAAMAWRGIFAETVSPAVFLVVKTVLSVFPEPLVVRFPSPLPLQYESVPLHVPEWALRAPFLTAGLLTVMGVFLLLRRRAGAVAAFFGALFLAVSPLHIYHSTEIRYYGLVCLGGLLLLWGLQALQEGRTVRGAGLTAAALLLGMLTHMSFALVAAASLGGYGLFTVLCTRPRRLLLQRVGLAGLVCAGAAALFLAVAVAGNPRHLNRVRNLVAPGAAQAVPAAPAGEAAEDPVDAQEKHRLSARNYFDNYLAARYLCCGGTAAALVVAPLVLLGLVAAFRRHRLLFFLLAANLLTAVPFFFLPVGHFWAPRYFIFQTVAAALLFGLGAGAAARGLAVVAARVRPGLRHAAPVLLLCVYLAAHVPVRAKNTESHNDWGARRLAEALAGQIQPAMDKIVYCKPHKGRFSYLLVPHYLGRLVPDWNTAGSVGKESFCESVDDFEDLLAAFHGDPFWIVSFNENNADPALNDLIAARGGKLHTDLGPSSLWIMGDLPQAGPAPWHPPAEEAEAVLPEEARMEEVSGPDGTRKRYSVILMLNDTEKPRTPTIFFPVCTAATGGEGCALERGARHVVRFRMRADDLRRVGNPKRTFRVMLEGKGSLTDLMYATGTDEGREYTLVFTPGADVPDGLVHPRIGFGNRGGTGTFEIEDFSCVVE